MAPHIAPAVLMVVAGAAAAGGAIVFAHRLVPGEVLTPDREPLEPNTMAEPGEVVAALLGGLATAFTVAATAQQLYTVQCQRVRRYEDRVGADAADAVLQAAGEYSRPLRRRKLAEFTETQPFERSLTGGGLSDLQHMVHLYCRYSLALRLSPEEGDRALDIAADCLHEEHPEMTEAEVRTAVRKAHAISKVSDQSALTELANFVSKTRQQVILGRADTPAASLRGGQ